MVVADAGPLIALARTGHLHLLRDILGVVEIPVAVEIELRIESDLPGATCLRQAVRVERWLYTCEPRSCTSDLSLAVGSGEAAAILLAEERKALLLIDDRRGRKAAAERGIVCIGTGRILLEAKRRGLLTHVAPVLSELVECGYRIAPALRERILSLAREPSA
jgi:predicted nucleic acid-binding protein